MKLFPLACCTAVAFWTSSLLVHLHAEDSTQELLNQSFQQSVQPFLKSYCLDCHGQEDPEAKLDLSGAKSLGDVTKNHQIWKEILHRVDAGEMPPPDYEPQPTQPQRETFVGWIRQMREHESHRNAGDPGVVLVRRLSHAEYNYTVRDLTGVDIQPTRTFPVDPSNEAGFDNSGESLAMSPALMNKYLAAAREVADHMVLTPSRLTFAPHLAVTDTDRDKYCVNRIIEFYNRQPTDLADYFFVCWKRQTSAANSSETLHDLATEYGVSPRYTLLIWETLHAEQTLGALQVLQEKFHDIPKDADVDAARRACEDLKGYVAELRPQFSKTFENLEISEVHKGSQSFVLWKNEQYAANRRKFDPDRLLRTDDEIVEGTRPELILPTDEEQRQRFLTALETFCSVFPDTFLVSERGRDYLGVPKEKQEKGRLLSAGFHSMMGYFRDDIPLCELILDHQQREELDQLWRELHFITFAPQRQYLGFLWFERTDSRYMRDPEFDFARAEDQNAASEAMIQKLSEVYLAKAKRNGGEGVALKAIADYFENINRQIRWVESERLKAEPIHREALLQFAKQAWRRELTDLERQQVHAFYDQLRREDGLDHVDAMRDSIVFVLMSPHFLYRTDLISLGEGTRDLTEFELANRLSYFLWSSAPDAELRHESRLRNHDALLQQVQRMLQDKRIVGLATEFATNWWDVRRFEEHNSVDRERFPQFNDELRQAMFNEPIHFFTELVRNDGSILDLLSADYTYVNRALADHYGMQNAVEFSGDEWKRIEKADAFERGGLLGMSVFLTKNSPGLRTSPVKRGYWVVRQILGEMIPPPPPNVPELPADENQLGELSLREVLERHRNHESCAGCHERFDTIGLAFEGFGPIGERREKDLGNRPVDTLALFPGGVQGTGLKGVRSYLIQHRRDEFIDNFCRKLLAYALGRTLLLSDEPMIETMKSELQANEYRFSSLMKSIITSKQFLTKRGSQNILQK